MGRSLQLSVSPGAGGPEDAAEAEGSGRGAGAGSRAVVLLLPAGVEGCWVAEQEPVSAGTPMDSRLVGQALQSPIMGREWAISSLDDERKAWVRFDARLMGYSSF